METCLGPSCHRRGYYAFGGDRALPGAGGDNHFVRYRFTNQMEDETGLYGYNARYYDPEIGQFASPDALVPDPSKLLAYNRFMYAYGNPLKYNDPSGHCSVLSDGSMDSERDSDCWQLVFGIYGYAATEEAFAKDWNIAPDVWLETIASQEFADADYPSGFYQRYDRAFRMRTGLPLPDQDVVWHEPDNPNVRLLGQFLAEDALTCAQDFPLGCANAADDVAMVTATGWSHRMCICYRRHVYGRCRQYIFCCQRNRSGHYRIQLENR